MSPLAELGLFAAKTFVIILCVVIILLVFLLFIAAIAKHKQKSKGKLLVRNLNEKYDETKELLLSETLNKKQQKQYAKEKKQREKQLEKSGDQQKKIFVINFTGDIRASQVAALTEEISAVLEVATPQDEVFLRLESGGGVVHGYGLAAAQLMRLRDKQIPLTVSIDKVAASGGYLMACVADKIIAAPFAIIGSIGVIVQLPNFHRFLRDKHIDFEQLTAGEFKRTLTVFGENTPEGREKLQEEIEKVHVLFKDLITKNRPQINIDQVATGEHWLAMQAIDFKLVDELKTGEDYLFAQSKAAKLYEICFETKKPLLARLTASAATQFARESIFESLYKQ